MEYASPGVSDVAGFGKAMEEFNQFVFGVWDRLRDIPMRKLEVNERDLELSERRRKALREAENHELDVERKRQENRSLSADADLKQVGLFQELRKILSPSDSPREFDRLMTFFKKGENSLSQLIEAGKITQVQEISTEGKTMGSSG